MNWTPGTWTCWLFGPQEIIGAVVICPQCGAGMSIGGGQVFGSCHSIDANGVVMPSVVCHRCAWHTGIRLLGWPAAVHGQIA